MEITEKRYQLVKKTTVFIVFFIVVIFGLIKAKSFLAPIFLAALLSYLLYPIGNFLEKHGIPRILANLISIIVGILVLGGVIYFFTQQFSVFAEDFPKMKSQATQNLQSVEKWASSTFNVSNEKIRSWIDKRARSLTSYAEIFKTAFQITSSTVLLIGLMPVYIFFMLYYRTKFYEFILKMAPKKYQDKTTEILDKVNKVTINYITGVFIVVFILSVLHSVGLSIIGLKYPIFLGITAALFNFIPYFGTLIGAIIPLLFSLLAMNSPNYALYVLIYFLIIQFVENNILTPNITGGSVRLNPFVTILSLILGSMVWGVAGMFMVIPFLGMLKIFCEHFTSLKPIAFLLSNRGTEKYSLTWDKIKNKFKKG